MHPDTDLYNQRQDPPHREVCVLLAEAIDRYLPEAENKGIRPTAPILPCRGFLDES